MRAIGQQENLRHRYSASRPNSATSGLIEELASRVRAAGVAIDRRAEQRIVTELTLRGEFEYERLVDDIGESVTPLRPSAVGRCGVGWALTRFMMAPVAVPERRIDAVASLGGLALFIVSQFDSILDHGGGAPSLERAEPGGDSAQIADFVALYYKRLDALGPGDGRVRAMLDKTIRRMHDAEVASASGGEARWSVWWRKGVFPLVVMALPAWLVAPDPRRSVDFRRHMAWVARIGQAFSYIDDCVDCDEDADAGHINRINDIRGALPDSEISSRVARQIVNVLQTWDTWSGRRDVRDIFPAVVTSWMRSQPDYPV